MTARKQARRMLLAALTSAPLLSSTIAYGDSSATGKPSLPAHRNTPAAQSTATGSTASGSATNGAKPTPGSVKPGSNGLRPVPVPTDAPAGVVPQVQQVQYQNKNQAQTQPQPQNTAASNGNVEAELNKLFRESGQEPPSMKSKDLPYANTPQMDKVRPKPQTQQPANQTAQQQPAKKKNAFQKFFGKLTGKNEETSTAEAPKPPELKTAPTAQAGTVQPKAGQAGNGQPRVGQAGTVQPRAGQQSGGQPSPAQPGMMRSASASQGQPQVRQPASRPQQFAQPGSAPAFLNGGGTRPVQPATPVQPSTLSQPRTAPKTVPAVPAAQAAPAEPRRQPVDDQFVDPFDGGSEPESDEELDLDSLLEIPQTPVSQPEVAAPAIAVPATAVPSVEVPTAGAPEVEIPTPRVAAPVANPFEAIEVPGPTPEEVSVSPRTSVPEQSAVTAEETAEGTEASAAPPVENPFTGVKLNVTDEEFFGGDSTGRATIENSGDDDDDDLDESEGDDDSEMDGATFGTPLPPVEEFSEDIPSIEISTPASTPAPQNGANAAPSAVPNTAPAVLPVPRQQHSMDAEQLQQAAEQVRRERQRRAIMSRPNLAGFKGFCPVELRDHRELVDTRPEFTATFGLQTYQFSSAQAKAAFESDPSRYAPAAGGSDVVLLVNTGEEQPGTLEYSLWYRDRLYLFRSRETMSLFSQDPSRFANQY